MNYHSKDIVDDNFTHLLNLKSSCSIFSISLLMSFDGSSAGSPDWLWSFGFLLEIGSGQEIEAASNRRIDTETGLSISSARIETTKRHVSCMRKGCETRAQIDTKNARTWLRNISFHKWTTSKLERRRKESGCRWSSFLILFLRLKIQGAVDARLQQRTS